MSQIEPEGYDDMEGAEAFEDFGDQPVEQRAWAGQPRPPRPPVGGWQPGFRPPPSWGPPGPGKWPFWGYWGYRMLAAWRDIRFLKKLVGEIVQEDILKAIEDGIIAPGPNSPVQGPGAGAGITGPILGVTDGSDAAPGQVGEFVHGEVDIPFAAATQTQATVSPLIVQPGDWDLWASLSVGQATATGSAAINGASANLQPVPPGMSNEMAGFMVAGGTAWMDIVTMSARGSFSVPTLLPFYVAIDGIQAGTATMAVEARRRR